MAYTENDFNYFKAELANMRKLVTALMETNRALMQDEINEKTAPSYFEKKKDLTFSEALSALKNNFLVTRAAWHNEKVFLYLWEGAAPLNQHGYLSEIRVKTRSGQSAPWMPTHQELLSEESRS